MPDGVRLLCANDEALAGLCADAPVATAVRGAAWMAEALAHADGHIVFAGAGTSGRLAQFHARGLNAAWRRAGAGAGGGDRAPFSYLLAGGDAAVVLPQEAAEDSDEAAAAALRAWAAARAGAGPRVLVAVSCGLSAAYVMGLVARCADDARWRVLVIGFNELASLREPLPAAFELLSRLLSSCAWGVGVSEFGLGGIGGGRR
jgi:N-acetylmuramic acid 6-phosphate (MurNAc-6-P) etherase